MQDINHLSEEDPFADPVTIPHPEEALSLSESAAKRIFVLAEQEEKPGAMLRLTVSGGGCSGYQYHFDFAFEAGPDDHVFESEGAKLVTDNESLVYLQGAQVDYIDNLTGAYFTVNNPNAKSSCGCRVSFAA